MADDPSPQRGNPHQIRLDPHSSARNPTLAASNSTIQLIHGNLCPMMWKSLHQSASTRFNPLQSASIRFNPHSSAPAEPIDSQRKSQKKTKNPKEIRQRSDAIETEMRKSAPNPHRIRKREGQIEEIRNESRKPTTHRDQFR